MFFSEAAVCLREYGGPDLHTTYAIDYDHIRQKRHHTTAARNYFLCIHEKQVGGGTESVPTSSADPEGAVRESTTSRFLGTNQWRVS